MSRDLLSVALQRDSFGERQNYLREAVIWSQLTHPNILPCLGVYYLNKGQKRLSLVSPWMESGNLVDFLNSHPRELVNHLQLVSCPSLQGHHPHQAFRCMT
jgi:serine/threonine protein kinase